MDCRVAQSSKYKELGGKGDWSSGVLKVHLRSWDEFHGITAQLLNLGDFIWRGQASDWSLKSRFDRVATSDREAKLQRHKEAFVHAIKGRRGNNPPELDTPEKIWSLGQHYGLATPLLDWTESPFVAAYFAFKEECFNKRNAAITTIFRDSQKENQKEAVPDDALSRFIYGLSKDIGRWGPAPSEKDVPLAHFIEFIEPESDENPRLLNQKGLFTMLLSPDIEIEETVKRCYAKDEERGLTRIIFVKVRIPELERRNCLRSLNRMNINHATLFPDLIGAAEYCNLKLEIENYS